jgi:hypothetical protein
VAFAALRCAATRAMALVASGEPEALAHGAVRLRLQLVLTGHEVRVSRARDRQAWAKASTVAAISARSVLLPSSLQRTARIGMGYTFF